MEFAAVPSSSWSSPIIFISQSVKFVPQQNAWVRERLGKYHGTHDAGPNFSSRSSTRWPTSTA